jgi:gliding motility-associated lipoprotein GldH
MGKCVLFSLLLAASLSCSDGLQVSEYRAIEGGSWNKDKAVEFTFEEIDTVDIHNMFISIRNDDTYPYSNLFLITELSFPDGQTVRDTLEYEMASPDGQWLGKGFGTIKENKLWYRENIVFPASGVYTLQISHAMRKNGSINGVIELQGITDVGFEIEKSK